EDFALPTPDGGSFKLWAQRGKVVLVNFWATWCPPCLEEMPAMERLWRRHKDAGFVLVAISLDADPKKVPPFVSARKFSFPIAVDPKMAVAERYGVRALPSSFVVDRQGMMAGVALGPRSWDDSAAHGLVQAMLRWWAPRSEWPWRSARDTSRPFRRVCCRAFLPTFCS